MLREGESGSGVGFSRLEAISHDLAPHYAALRAIRTRRRLVASELWARIGAEVERVTTAVERGDHRLAEGRPRQAGRLRVASWNIQRGARFAELVRALGDDPLLAAADVLILVEVDQGMGRSGNRHVARELADALGMNFAFAPSYLALEDDFGENPDQLPSTLALAGQAILSRLPITRAENVDLPELRDKFSSSEKRLGKKRALLVELALGDAPLTVGGCHLDSNASPAQRATQLEFLLGRAEAWGGGRALVGGDMNTTTYDNSSTWALARDLLHKAFVLGFRGTIERYMVPERYAERPVFATLERHGFSVEGFNDRGRGSYVYELNSPYAIQIAEKAVGRLITSIIRWRLRPWGGRVPARLDWFAGRGVVPAWSGVATVEPTDGIPVSDHSPIVVDLAV